MNIYLWITENPDTQRRHLNELRLVENQYISSTLPPRIFTILRLDIDQIGERVSSSVALPCLQTLSSHFAFCRTTQPGQSSVITYVVSYRILILVWTIGR